MKEFEFRFCGLEFRENYLMFSIFLSPFSINFSHYNLWYIYPGLQKEICGNSSIPTSPSVWCGEIDCICSGIWVTGFYIHVTHIFSLLEFIDQQVKELEKNVAWIGQIGQISFLVKIYPNPGQYCNHGSQKNPSPAGRGREQGKGYTYRKSKNNFIPIY